MSPATWGFLGAVAGPLLVFITWLASRRQAASAAQADLVTATVNASLSTTETMRLLLKPLEDEIAELRTQVTQLRFHIQLLENQVREMGGKPISLNDIGMIVDQEEWEEFDD